MPNETDGITGQDPLIKTATEFCTRHNIDINVAIPLLDLLRETRENERQRCIEQLQYDLGESTWYRRWASDFVAVSLGQESLSHKRPE